MPRQESARIEENGGEGGRKVRAARDGAKDFGRLESKRPPHQDRLKAMQDSGISFWGGAREARRGHTKSLRGHGLLPTRQQENSRQRQKAEIPRFQRPESKKGAKIPPRCTSVGISNFEIG